MLLTSLRRIQLLNKCLNPQRLVYSVWIPGIKEKTPRLWTRDGKSNTSKLKVTRTRTNTTNRISDPYPVQDTPRQDTFNSQRSTSSSNSGTRVTKRN